MIHKPAAMSSSSTVTTPTASTDTTPKPSGARVRARTQIRDPGYGRSRYRSAVEHSTASETVPRPLTPHERAILDLLLGGDFPGAAELRVQAERVQVVARCGCGCDSYDVGLTDPDVPRADFPNGPIPQELAVTDPDGTYYGSIIMLAHNGVLSYLDFHTWDDRPLTGLPPVEHLSVISR